MTLDDIPPEERERWKVVRTDQLTDVPGRVVSADEQSGICVMESHGEQQQYNLGPHGLKIMPRSRYG